MEMTASKQSVYHIAIRYAALASRPALIWLLVMLDMSTEAAGLGSLILVASIIGMAMSNESHLQLYATIFGQGASSNKLLHRLLLGYLHSLTTHMVLITIPAFVACLWLFPKVNPWLAIGLALAERVSDEVLRMKLYRKEWDRWTVLLLGKNLIPASLTFVAITCLPKAVEAWYTMGALAFAVWLLSAESKAVLRALRGALRRLPNISYIRSYLLSYSRVLSIRQIAAILSLNLIALDRYVGMNIWSGSDMAYIVLVGQIISGIFFVIEAKHLSEHRANFINSSAKLKDFWTWRPYISLILACALASATIFFVGTNLSVLPEMPTNSYIAVGLMLLNYGIFYLSLPLSDYLYYRGWSKHIAIGHVLTFAVCATLMLTFNEFQAPYAVLSIMTAALIGRAVILVLATKKIDASLGLITNS